MDAMPVCFRLEPLANIAVPFGCVPDAIAVLKAIFPLAIIDLTVFPPEDTLTTRLSILILPIVAVTVWKLFKPLTMT
jgi:hypothetical protein